MGNPDLRAFLLEPRHSTSMRSSNQRGTASSISRPLSRDHSDTAARTSRSNSPFHPPHSPITPVAELGQAIPASDESRRSSSDGDVTTLESLRLRSRADPGPVVDPPPPGPVSESTNFDAIALRAAISVLQVQRARSARDIQRLHDLKAAALSEPERFAQDLLAGNFTDGSTSNPLHATLSDLYPEAVRSRPERQEASVRLEGQPRPDEIPDSQATPATSFDSEQQPQREHQHMDSSPATPFPRIPQPQNVVRMPAINWAKYHVVGESLDKLHEEQRRRPDPGEPSRGVG